jgi:uncharacterized protein YbjT (DUF2867 family)
MDTPVKVYELTGPRLLTFVQAVEEIAEVTGRKVEFLQFPKDTFVSTLAAQGVPDEVVKLITYSLITVLDGRNAHLTDGVQRALCRQSHDFTEYVQQTAAAGAWYA